jgi:hypothetical protein
VSITTMSIFPLIEFTENIRMLVLRYSAATFA